MEEHDNYVNSMDWVKGKSPFSVLQNYRKYQFNLIEKYIGTSILEVGTGDKCFTSLICSNKKISRLLSIEPSSVLYNLPEFTYDFPDSVSFEMVDLFDLSREQTGLFDTIIFIHVLEHIEDDKGAIEAAYNLLPKGGYILIQVPALKWLFSVHDEILGHFRRYNKPMLRDIIDPEKFEIIKLWYQDPIGILGSLYYFKIRKIKLKSENGQKLVGREGAVYDKYIIPFESTLEKIITFPLGLSLSVVLRKK